MLNLGLCARIAFSGAVCAALLAPIQASASETLRAFAQRLLVQAPGNFSNVRGTRKDSDDYYVRYVVSSVFARTCRQCTVTDQYAWTAHPENWYLEERWSTPKIWSQAKLSTYVTGQLSPILSAYALHKTGSKDYPTFTWSSAKGTFVYADVFQNGFTLRVGHDLVRSVHVLLAPSETELAALRAGVSSLVNSGVGSAPDNFESLRTGAGKRDAVGGMEYGINVSFGPMLRQCGVEDDSVNTLGMSDFSPKWTLSCQTPPMVGTLATLEEQVRAAMYDALPSGFTTTTGSLLGLDDYRWDYSYTQVAADIGGSFFTYGLPPGLVQFDVGIVHFLPKS